MAQLVKVPAAKSDDPSLTSRIYMVEGESQQLPQADWPLISTRTMAHVHAHTYMNKYFQSYSIDCNIFICGCNLQKSPEVPRMLIVSLRSNLPYLSHVCQSVNWNLKISVKDGKVALANLRFMQRRALSATNLRPPGCPDLGLWPANGHPFLVFRAFCSQRVFCPLSFFICSQQDALIFASNVHMGTQYFKENCWLHFYLK